MIKYNLICEQSHEFEVWFSKSSDFDAQAPKGLIECPYCGDIRVQKAIMAPNISTSRKKDAVAAAQSHHLQMMNAMADKIRQGIKTQCDYVGDKFANEARAIHYGEKEKRGIYGQATAQEASDLKEEGVGFSSLPNALVPKPKQNLN